MLTTLKDVMAKAQAGGFAVGAFNTVNLASIRAVIDAAETLNQPVILQHAELHEAIAPLDLIGSAMLKAADKARVPVCVHLDHGTDLDYLQKAMDMGFTSVMFDGSALAWEDNIAQTSQVVAMAKAKNVSVEAELGRVLRPEGGGEVPEEEEDLSPEDFYTKPEEALAFVQATDVDALAIAFGTAHGVYAAEPKLDFERIAAIRDRVQIPLVMHGGSGVSDRDFARAIEKGIRKVNYFTYMSIAGGDGVKDFLSANACRSDIRFDELETAARLAMQRHAEHAIHVFSHPSEEN